MSGAASIGDRVVLDRVIWFSRGFPEMSRRPWPKWATLPIGTLLAVEETLAGPAFRAQVHEPFRCLVLALDAVSLEPIEVSG